MYLMLQTQLLYIILDDLSINFINYLTTSDNLYNLFICDIFMQTSLYCRPTVKHPHHIICMRYTVNQLSMNYMYLIIITWT